MRAIRPILTAAALAAALAVTAFSAPDVERVEMGNLVIEQIPEIPDRVTERLRQYQNTRSASLSGWHPSGEGILVSTRFGEVSQIHHVAEAGGARRQLTFFNEPVNGATPSPDPKVNGFIFSKDVGGSEFYQMFFFDLATGESRMLTDGKSRNGGANWANDGKRFSYYTTARNGKDWDIVVGDVRRPGEARTVLEGQGAWVGVDWSPDDGKLLVLNYISANESHPYLVDVKSGEKTRINPTEERVAYSALAFSRDGKGVYFASDQDDEFKRLRYYDLATSRQKILTADIPWDVSSVELSDDGKLLAFTTNEDGISKLYVKRLPGWENVALPKMPLGQVYGLEFNEDASKLGVVVNSARTPGDVFVVDVAGKKLARWTQSEVGGLDADSFIVPELVHYETFDTVDGKPREIPAFYYKPEGKGPHPVIIEIHGGPESQARPFFSPSRRSWVGELGAALLRPNVRGSAGYGKSYLQLDNDYSREESVKDIGALLDWIEEQPDLDADRVAVYGGSYGGYMVLSSMVHYNDRLRCGVDVVGISNFVTFLKNTQDYRRDLRRVEYGDERIPEMNAFLEKISPSNHAEEITKPLFIVQGLNDPRVPASESEQMVEEIRTNGGDVWYLLAKDEGHGFRKKTNRDYYQAAASLFLEEYLLGESAGSAAGASRR